MLSSSKEFAAYRRLCAEWEKGGKTFETCLKGKPAEITLSWNVRESGYTKLWIGDTEITVSFDNGDIEFANPQMDSEAVMILFDKKAPLNLDFVIDQEVIEFFGNNGVICGAVETEENVLRKNILIESELEPEVMKFYEIAVS